MHRILSARGGLEKAVHGCRLAGSFSGVVPLEQIQRVVKTKNPDGTPTVEIRFNVARASWIDPQLKERFVQRYAHRINSAGEMVIESQRSRSEQLNISDCVDKLRHALFELDKVGEESAEQGESGSQEGPTPDTTRTDAAEAGRRALLKHFSTVL